MNYHTNTHGPSEAGFRTGFLKSISEASSNKTNQVLFFAHSLKHLQVGVCNSVLGQATVKSLAETKTVTLGTVTIYLETERTKSVFLKGVIFAPFVSHKLLEVAATDYRGTDIVYVPWALEELQTYVQNNPASIQL